MHRRSLLLIVIVSALVAPLSQAQQAPLVEQYLVSGQLAAGEAALLERLKAQPGDDQARFGLGFLQAIQSLQRLSQSFHRYGAFASEWTRNVPLLRTAMPAGVNPDPQKVTYEDIRKVLVTFLADLEKAQTTLAAIKDPGVKLPLRFGLIKLDFNGDGQAADEETLWRLYAQVNRGARASAEAAEKFVIAFDAGDVYWLRGYCHLLSAMAEFALAHDGSELFDTTGHLFFARAQTPHAWVQDGQRVMDIGGGADIADIIAFIHMIRLPVKEPQRLASASAHLSSMLSLSRQSWKAIMAETDDDNEWVPNPKQTSVIPNAPVTAEMVQGWHDFIAEAEELLAGKKLIPFWRSKSGVGVNLRRVLAEPRPFDLVLWIQGTAATPYLENGPLTEPATWNRFMRIFQGEFIGYALWFN